MDHTHCRSCVSLHCQQTSPCSIDYCPNGCGFSMHQCKLDEHDRHTCPEAVTPCPSAGYGCTELMKRREVVSHIEHCPASNVTCQFSHQRIEHEQTKAIPVPHSTSPGDRDELIDRKFLKGDLNVWRTEKLQVTTNTEERKSWVPQWVEKVARKKMADGMSEVPSEAAHHEYNEASNSSPDLSLDTNIGLMTKGYWVAKRRFTQEALTLHKRACIDTLVTTNKDPYTTRPLSHNHRCCTFACNEVVRRDEYSSHWKTLHLDIQLSSLVRRCPMRLYGCQYGVQDLAPLPEGSVLDYDQEMDSFLHKLPAVVATQEDTSSSQYAAEIQKKQELALYGYDDFDEESFDVLGQLPAEVLMAICGFLDSQSLWVLSQVNHYLRKVCLNVVKKAGIVYQNWERDSSGSWVPGPKIWAFSKAFQGIAGWRHTDQPSVCAHMMSCDYIKANLKSFSSDRVHVMINSP